MPKELPYLPQPGKDERAIVGEMLQNPTSIHWEKCNDFVKRLVYKKAKNIPADRRDEGTQEAMYKIAKYLSSFHFACAFKTWLYQIVCSCIVDSYRKMQNEDLLHLSSTNQLNEDDPEYIEKSPEAESAEQVYERNTDIQDGIAALFEYAQAHSHPIRDQYIIRMVIIEGYPQVQVAGMVGCEAAVVSHVVREAQRYAREKLRHK